MEYKPIKIDEILDFIHNINRKYYKSDSDDELSNERFDDVENFFNIDYESSLMDDIYYYKDCFYYKDKINKQYEINLVSSSLSIINCIISNLRRNFIFEKNLMYFTNENKILIHYYIFNTLLICSRNGFNLSSLMENINIEYIKKNNLIESGFDKILYQKEFYLIKKFLIKLEKKLINIYNKDIRLVDKLLNEEISLKNIKNRRNNLETIHFDKNVPEEINLFNFNFPKMEQLDEIFLKKNLYLICNKIILIYKSIEDLIMFYQDITYFQKEISEESKDLEFNDEILFQIKKFMIYPLCIKLYSKFFDDLSLKIIHINWDIDESHVIYNFSEVNFYVSQIMDKMQEIFQSVVYAEEIKNPILYFKNLIEIQCYYINDKLIEIFSKIKKVNFKIN